MHERVTPERKKKRSKSTEHCVYIKNRTFKSCLDHEWINIIILQIICQSVFLIKG